MRDRSHDAARKDVPLEDKDRLCPEMSDEGMLICNEKKRFIASNNAAWLQESCDSTFAASLKG